MKLVEVDPGMSLGDSLHAMGDAAVVDSVFDFTILHGEPEQEPRYMIFELDIVASEGLLEERDDIDGQLGLSGVFISNLCPPSTTSDKIPYVTFGILLSVKNFIEFT
jgi:hypothetical protein